MDYEFPPDVAKLIDAHLATGVYSSKDDVLRNALAALAERQNPIIDEDSAVIDGVRRGLDQMARGLGRPFVEFDSEFQKRHGSS